MSVRRLLFIGLFATLTAVVGEDPPRFVVLPARAALPYHQFSGWMPAKSDIDSLEANLAQVVQLRAENWRNYRMHIDHPETYYRQYVGVVRKARRMLYVNAFCRIDDSPDWRTEFVLVSDGATCYWQAWYDPATKRFSHLTVNGRG